MTPEATARHLRRVQIALWIGTAAILLFLGGMLLHRAYLPDPKPEVISSGEADIHADFSLTDHTGRAVTEADFAGRWQFVFLGFTHCPDICPTTLAYMASVLDLLGPEADRIAPLFITVDPVRDTAPVLAEYVSHFGDRLIGLTGTEAQIAEAAQNFRTWYEKVEDDAAPDGYMMAHAGHIYLMRPDGSFETAFQEREQPASEVAEAILVRFKDEESTP